MSNRAAGIIVCLLAVQAGAAPIPPNRQIASTVVRHIEAPADMPLSMPTDVAVDSNGRIYVADGVNRRIVRFGADGTFLDAFGSMGDVALMNPISVTIDAQKRLWVADTGRHEIVRGSLGGESGEAIALPVSREGEPADPTDIAVTPDGRRTYVVDNDHDRVLIRDNRSGIFESKGQTGEGLGEFQWPFMISLDVDGYAYITDVIGARVHRMNEANDWLPPISRWGIELGRLYRPKGLVVDPQRRIHVADSSMSVIQVFNYRGRVLGVLMADDQTARRFDHPMGLALDADGSLLVVESLANRVAVVKLTWPDATSRSRRGGAAQ